MACLELAACGHKSPAAPDSRPGKTGRARSPSSAPPSWRIGALRIQSRAFPQAKRMHRGHRNEKSDGSSSSKTAAISIWPTLFRISRPISIGGMRMPNRKYRRPLPMDALPIRSSDVPLFSEVIG
jgi:hypothetical protein